MRIISLVTIVLIMLGFYKQPETDVILWSNVRLLTWDDFKGLPDTSNKHAAVTSCNIKTNFKTKKDSLYIKAISYMQPSKSWVKIKSVSLLKHEQIHFDITELYIRKLRQSILSTKFIKTKIGEDIQKMTDNYITAFKKYGAQYDLETNHSLIKVKQLEWEKKIAKELKELEMYNNTDLKILLK